ncbi:flagellar export chaperone FliS, partial [Escherichia coli]|nr:flagellar export chaperone FliS [Escherichia coli]
MYAAKGTQAYAQIGVESAVMSASQQQLVTMLFDGVLSALVRARLFMQDNNQQGKGVSLSKAINIIENGLRVSLDEESKDELTQNLMNRPGFPGECFICELRLPDHRFRWKHNKL